MHTSALVRARFLAVLLALLLVAATTAIAAPAAQAAVVKPLDIVKIHFDPPGKDAATNSGYTQEYIQVKNTGSSTLTLTGYTIRDDGPQKFSFPKGTKLAAGKTLTIRSGTGKNSATTLYWNKASYIWNNTGDSARTYNSAGKLLETCKYTSNGTASTKTC
jgi:hypothetical protein